MNELNKTYCGFVAILGRPNVGKSSLLNAMIGQKISITSFKPQTTRHQILGIKTFEDYQTVYVDTPGMHLNGKKALNRHMNKMAKKALSDINAVIFVVEALKWTPEDNAVCLLLNKIDAPIIVALNKIDLVKDKKDLLHFIQFISEKISKAHIVPVSAKKRIQVEALEKAVIPYLPEGPFYFPKDQVKNHSDTFFISEIVREKLLFSLEKELPYSITVSVESVSVLENIVHISCIIWVEREGQKAIVVGEKGNRLKQVGIYARKDLENFYKKKVNLKLWVKIAENWADSVQMLGRFGLGMND